MVGCARGGAPPAYPSSLRAAPDDPERERRRRLGSAVGTGGGAVGTGEGVADLAGVTIDGEGRSRLFDVAGTLLLEDVAVTNAFDSLALDVGGGFAGGHTGLIALSNIVLVARFGVHSHATGSSSASPWQQLGCISHLLGRRLRLSSSSLTMLLDGSCGVLAHLCLARLRLRVVIPRRFLIPDRQARRPGGWSSLSFCPCWRCCSGGFC